MKILMVLCALQTAIILLLVVRTVPNDESINMSELKAMIENVNREAAGLHANETNNLDKQKLQKYTPQIVQTNDQLRSIIQEELAQYFEENPVSSKSDKIDNVAAREYDEALQQAYLDNANQRFQQYINAGAISHKEMKSYLADAGKLSELQREQVLREFTQAMNSGQIKFTR